LAIAIPTYNRSEILEENLRIMLPELKQYRVPVFISDDSSDSKTEILIDSLSQEYEGFSYRRNWPSLGHDKNFFATLEMADYDYVWYLGDSLYFKSGCLQEIIEAMQADVDFIFVNSYAKDMRSRIVGDARDFLLTRAWYLTLTGATIYGRRPRRLFVDQCRKAIWRNFVQLGLVFEYCSQKSAVVYWLGTPSIGFNKKKNRSYWTSSALDVFVEDWTMFVQSFPALFSASEMKTVIRSHAVHTGIFGIKSLILIRAYGGLSVSIVQRHKSSYVLASPTSVCVTYAVALLPVFLLRGLVGVFYFLRGFGRSPG
jgi:glycosyltransferase involved in cell wall biosynthesis